jgi:hypothetical protein
MDVEHQPKVVTGMIPCERIVPVAICCVIVDGSAQLILFLYYYQET